jgi:hypothetical protein
MAGLVPAISLELKGNAKLIGIAGPSPAMTSLRTSSNRKMHLEHADSLQPNQPPDHIGPNDSA